MKRRTLLKSAIGAIAAPLVPIQVQAVKTELDYRNMLRAAMIRYVQLGNEQCEAITLYWRDPSNPEREAPYARYYLHPTTIRIWGSLTPHRPLTAEELNAPLTPEELGRRVDSLLGFISRSKAFTSWEKVVRTQSISLFHPTTIPT